MAITIQDFFDSQSNEIIELLLKDDNLELLYSFLFNKTKHQNEMYHLLSDILLKIDSVSYTKDDICQFLEKYFNNDNNMREFCFELGNVLTAHVFSDEYSENTSERQLMQYIQTGIFWTLFPKAVKKCLGRNLYTEMIPDNIISGYPKSVITKCVTSFNIDANTYARNTEMGLDTILHKRYYAKRIKTQKKNVSRVRKRIKKVIMLYKSKYSKGRAFNNGLSLLPDSFISAIRSMYF